MDYSTTIKYPIKYYEMLKNKALKESSLLLLLQDIATQNADWLGFGADFMFANNYAWFLLKYKIVMTKWPKDEKEIIIKTVPRGFHKYYAYRDFFIYDSNNNEIGRVASCWTLIDLDSKRPKNIADVKEYPISYEKQEGDLEFDKIFEAENYSNSLDFKVIFDDIDVNCHANNANYIRWALSPLDDEFRENHFIEETDMIFKHEIKCGELLTSCVAFEGNTTNHILKNKETGDTLCQMKIKWGKI